MAIKDVREYYNQMTFQYVELKRMLNDLENLPELKASEAYKNIDKLREQYRTVEANYNRLSYIMFLLDEPKKKAKKERYRKQEKKKLDKIPEADRKNAVISENQQIIQSIQSYI